MFSHSFSILFTLSIAFSLSHYIWLSAICKLRNKSKKRKKKCETCYAHFLVHTMTIILHSCIVIFHSPSLSLSGCTCKYNADTYTNLCVIEHRCHGLPKCRLWLNLGFHSTPYFFVFRLSEWVAASCTSIGSSTALDKNILLFTLFSFGCYYGSCPLPFYFSAIFASACDKYILRCTIFWGRNSHTQIERKDIKIQR